MKHTDPEQWEIDPKGHVWDCNVDDENAPF